MRLALEARAEPSRLMQWLSPLIAAALTIVAGFILFSALGKNPVQAFYTFFIHPIRPERRRRAASQSVTADADRRGPRLRLPRECLEHRRRGPACARRYFCE